MADLPSDTSLESLLIAQAVTCYYPISDIYASTGRYLYYTLLVLAFITPRHGWLANIFLGAAVSYAATASIEAFVLLTAHLGSFAPQNVSIPYISPSNNSGLLASIPSLLVGTNVVEVQPDYLELDIDAVTCVVITAYLVGLPLQLWSSTTRSSRILHILILIWNIVMLAGSISVLILWPSLNVAPAQYRFCYAGYGDDNTFQNPGWDSEYFHGDWNASIATLFGGNLETNELWWNLSSLCFYPCFNTSQVLRQEISLKATVLDVNNTSQFHTEQSFLGDPFQPLIYAALATFTIAQLYLLAVGRLHLCTNRVPIYEPSQLWTARKEILQSFKSDVFGAWAKVRQVAKNPRSFLASLPKAPMSMIQSLRIIHKHPAFKFIIDLTTLIVMLLVMICGPMTIVVFIIWIERYIHSDGTPNEIAQAVGQWSLVVQIAVVLVAALLLRLRHMIASEEEIDREIERAKLHVEKLEGIAEKKRQRAEDGQTSNVTKLKDHMGLKRTAKVRDTEVQFDKSQSPDTSGESTQVDTNV